jgi:NADH-quinone oxidoreductase subunit L
MVEHAYLIPLLPLAAALVIFFFGDWLPRKGSWIGVAAMGVCLVFSIDLFMRWSDGSLKVPYEMSWPWFSAGIYPFEWGIVLDGLSLIMLLMVTTVSFLIQFYSVGYMHGAPYFKRFFAYLSLFTFSMLILVTANNYLQFFVGWEIMGFCSYALIGFEFERDAAAAAGIKAFVTTKLGDLGFYAGLLAIFFSIGTFNFAQIQNHLADGTVSPNVALMIGLLVFAGAIGKSAQLPLHVWLPDAMEGPTPVSALIHAATMVAAGVFLVARSYGFFIRAPQGLEVVAWVGGLTLLFAATIALTANDIKKVLAYSTISQLGYMMMALGVTGYTAALFHLTTHAAFKALLFLGAGSVIHAVHTNDMWKMGSLSKQMITTAITFLLAAAALAGIPPTAGAYSKDMILTAAYQTQHTALFAMGCVGAFLTAFYAMRACALTFLGDPRERDRFTHAHESPWSMTIPMMALAVLSVLAGWLLTAGGTIEKLVSWPGLAQLAESHLVYWVALGSAASGVVIGAMVYLGHVVHPQTLASVFRPFYLLFYNKWYVDQIYAALFVRPTLALARGVAWADDHILDAFFVDGWGVLTQKDAVASGWLDDHWVDGLVNATGAAFEWFGAQARRLQTGFVQNYLAIITLGLVLLFIWKVF